MTNRGQHSSPIGRRTFVKTAGSGAAYISGLAAFSPLAARTRFDRPCGKVVQQEAWGRLEEVADGVWALVSAPLDDRTTLCNGGLIAGENAVLAVEGFASTRGSQWMGERARALTGRWPTHVVLSHYHGDHTNGVAGFVTDGETPEIHATAATRDRVLVTDRMRDGGPDEDRERVLSNATLLSTQRVTEFDLGGRTVRVIPRAGHTPSDVTVELLDPSVVFCGDLVWNGMFPNYVDAVPSRLSRDVRALRREEDTVYVPGHGRLGGNADLVTFIRVLDAVEEAARKAFERGIPPADAAAEFQLPPDVGEWFMFSPQYYERALTAWDLELQNA